MNLKFGIGWAGLGWFGLVWAGYSVISFNFLNVEGEQKKNTQTFSSLEAIS